MKLLNRVIDFLQEKFPPNRVAVLLAGPITAVSGTTSAWLAANVPGAHFTPAEITAFGLAAAAIAARMFDRWIDGWQKGDPFQLESGLERTLLELDPGEIRALADAIDPQQGESGETNTPAERAAAALEASSASESPKRPGFKA